MAKRAEDFLGDAESFLDAAPAPRGHAESFLDAEPSKTDTSQPGLRSDLTATDEAPGYVGLGIPRSKAKDLGDAIRVRPELGPAIVKGIGADMTQQAAGAAAMLEGGAATAVENPRHPGQGWAGHQFRNVDPAARAAAFRESAAEHLATAKEAGLAEQDALPKDASFAERQLYGAGVSLAESLGALALGVVTGPAGPVVAATVIGAGQGAERYAQLRNLGRSEQDATASALKTAGIESVTEFLPGKTLLKKSPGYAGFKRKLIEFFAEEIPGENITTVGEMVDDYANGLRDDITLGDLAQAVSDTTIQTTLAGGAQAGGMHLLQEAATRANGAAAARANSREEGVAPPSGQMSADQVLEFVAKRRATLEAAGELKPQHQQELDFLRDHADRPMAVAQAYGLNIDPKAQLLTPGDIASPLPNDLIAQGKATAADALAGKLVRPGETLGQPESIPPVTLPTETANAEEVRGDQGQAGEGSPGGQPGVQPSAEQSRGDLQQPAQAEPGAGVGPAAQEQRPAEPVTADSFLDQAVPPAAGGIASALSPESVAPVTGGAAFPEEAAAGARKKLKMKLGTEPGSVPSTPTAEQALTPSAEAKTTVYTPTPEKTNALRALAGQAGWAQVGGKLLREGAMTETGLVGEGQGAVNGRTKWLPKAEWWPDRPAKRIDKKTGQVTGYNEAETADIIEKGINGKLLGKNQRVYFDFLNGLADESLKSVDYMPTADELREHGLEQDADTNFETALVARALEIDENAAERAAVQHGDDDAAYYRAIKEIVDAGRPRESGGESGARTTSGATDLFGQDTRQAQTLADEQRARDEARSPNRDVSVETGNPADLFSQARGQRDITDLLPQRVSGATIRGEKVGNGFTKFSDTSGTLGIPRKEMPQVKAEHRGALANFLKARGIEGTEETVPASSLKPTQAEFSEQKVLKAKNFEGGDRAILVSSDGYVLDGHHQWLAKLDQHEDVRAIKLDAPIRDLLKVVPEFPSAEGGTPAAIGAEPVKPRDQPASANVTAADEDEHGPPLSREWTTDAADENRPSMIWEAIMSPEDSAIAESWTKAKRERAKLGRAPAADALAWKKPLKTPVAQWKPRILDYLQNTHDERPITLTRIAQDLAGQAEGNIIMGETPDDALWELIREGAAQWKTTAVEKRVWEQKNGRWKVVPGKTKPGEIVEFRATPSAELAVADKPREPIKPSANTVFTDDAAARARAILKSKLGQASAGVDPEILQNGIILAGYHIEKGARTFAAYSKAMIDDLGEAIRPYLKSLYLAVKFDPRAGVFADTMDSAAAVESVVAGSEDHAAGVTGDLERDSGNAEPGAPGNAPPDESAAGPAAESVGRPGEDTGIRGGLAESDARVRNGGATPARESSDQPLHSDEGQRLLEGEPTGADDGGRSDLFGDAGISAERPGSEESEKALERVREQRAKLEAQTAANRVPVVLGDAANIDKSLPYLLDGQREDVKKTEDRFAKPDGYGMLFTNGTGTGKTFTGLGVIRRFVSRGKKNVLIMAPSDKIMDDWMKSGRALGLTINALEHTKTAGNGLVITTYANAGQNRHLADRNWDLVVADEAHYLMQGKDATTTDALHTVRAITLHPEGTFQRAKMIHRDLADRVDALAAEIQAKVRRQDDPALARAYAEFNAKHDDVKAAVMAGQGSTRPRLLALSATPFAYEKAVDWANGYLFDYAEAGTGKSAETSRGYNGGDNRDQFFMQHFGYRMRYNKLTEPDAKVDRGVMQRQFNSWLKKQGSLSGRVLDVNADYDRRFVTIESKIGNRIDALLDWVRDTKGLDESARNAKHAIYEGLAEKFDHLSRRYLLEAIKAEASVDYAKKHMALGRKVVVFHDYKKGGGFNPFVITLEQAITAGHADHAAVVRSLAEYNEKFADLIESDIGSMRSPLQTYQAEFPGALIFNGDESTKNRRERVARFNDDATGPQVMLVQSASGKEGISLHDITGKHPRVMLNLGLPTQPTTAIQQEGRTYRVGQVSDAMFRYFNTGTSWEKWAFATTIAERASAAENLAQGEQARALKDAFIAGFEEADEYPPGMEGEGKGGKERDRAANEALSEFDRAVAFYWGTEKKSARTKAREGADYFATPEPVGLKMAEWAGIRPGDKVLEPSAGHGAIARWFPSTAENTAIEPSNELASRLAMVFDGAVKQQRFEDLNVGANKYDAIVMNPPFGHGGSTAIEHLDKAVKHLRDGGRVVALIPTGPAADAKFDKWYQGPDGEGRSDAYLAADIKLPAVTFERAATKVMARIVVLDKLADAARAVDQAQRDLSNAEDIKELFSRIENMSVPERPAALVKEEPAPGSHDAAAASGTFEAAQTVHGKTGEPLYVAKITRRLSAEEYQAAKRTAKGLNGWYSSFKGAGAIPGFQFKKVEDRDAFIGTPSAAGDETPSFSIGDAGTLDEIIQEYGEPVESVPDAERKFGDYAIYAFNEMDETPSEVTSVEMLRNYTLDRLVAVPRSALAEQPSYAMTDNAKAKAAAVFEDLKVQLAKVGIADRVGMKLAAVITDTQGTGYPAARGMYQASARMIQIAMHVGDKAHVLNHEIVHALKDLGVIRDAEWLVLSAKARADAPLMKTIHEKYDHLKLSDAKITEEAVAELHAQWADGKLEAKGFMRTAFERIRNFFDALRNAWQGQGFQSADDVFGRIGSGEMGARPSYARAGFKQAASFSLGDQEPRFRPRVAAQIRRGEVPTFTSPESEARWQEARKGVEGGKTWLQSLTEGADHIVQGFSRHFIHLPNTPLFSPAREQLRKIEAAPQASKEEVIRTLRAITDGMSRNDLDLFTRKAVLDDLAYEVEQEHQLPFGFTPADVRNETARLDAVLKDRPEITAKLELRRKLADKIAAELVASGVLHKEQIKNPAYYRHQVLDYARAQVAYAKGAPKKLKTPHWARRMGSTLDINANLLEAEFEWMQKALTDIAVARTIEWFKDSDYNVRDQVIANAKANNDRLMKQLLDTDMERNGYIAPSGRETSPLNEQWMGFKQRIAIGLGKVREALESGAVGEIPDEFQKIAGDLVAQADSERSIFPFLAWMLDNNKPGSMGAAMAFKAIGQRKSWVKAMLGERYADPMQLDNLVKRGFAPEGHTTWQPDEGKLLFTAKTIPEHVVDRMISRLADEHAGPISADELRGAFESVRSMLATGGPKYQLVIPQELADTLSHIKDAHQAGLVDYLFAAPMAKWKQWTLINLHRVLKYNLNNLSGDLDAVIAGSPKALRKMGRAISELRQVMLKGQTPSARYKEAIDRGVFDSGLTVQEIPDINYLSEFERFTKRSVGRTLTAPAAKTWTALKKYTQFRENWLRYAAYLDYVERLEAGESMKSIGYGAANRHMVDAITDNKDKAALLARELVGDYGAVSHFGQGLRRTLIPFYSWIEINARRYWRLGGNAWSQGIGQGFRTTGLIGATLGVRTTAYLGMRAMVLYALVQLWNNLVHGDDEDKLGAEERARLHLILGHDANGQVMSLKFQGALSDFLEWFGMNDAVGMMSEVNRGRASYGDVIKAMAKAPFNKLAGGITPLLTTPIELATGRDFWPDIFNPRVIRDEWRSLAQLYSLENEYDLIFDRPTRGYARALTDSVAYQRDPGEAAYNRIKGMAHDWEARTKGDSGAGAITPRSTAMYEWRLAKKYGDKPAERAALARMRALGVRNQDLRASLRNAHPLGSLSLKDRAAFIKTLSPRERAGVQDAIRWYRDTYLND